LIKLRTNTISEITTRMRTFAATGARKINRNASMYNCPLMVNNWVPS